MTRFKPATGATRPITDQTIESNQGPGNTNPALMSNPYGAGTSQATGKWSLLGLD